MAPKEIPLLPSSPSPSISLSVNRDKNSFLPRRGSEDDGGLSHILEETDTQRIPLRSKTARSLMKIASQIHLNQTISILVIRIMTRSRPEKLSSSLKRRELYDGTDGTS